MSSFFRGTSSAQDARFSDKEQKLYKTVKFPANFNTKVNMEKVNADVMHAWIANRLLELLGFEDEIVVEMVYEHLREKVGDSPDPKLLHIHLSGFLQDKTTEFTSELWSLLISAQESLAGIPQRFIDEKKAEIRQTRNKESAAVDQFIERREQHLGLRGQDQIGSGKRPEPPSTQKPLSPPRGYQQHARRPRSRSVSPRSSRHFPGSDRRPRRDYRPRSRSPSYSRSRSRSRSRSPSRSRYSRHKRRRSRSSSYSRSRSGSRSRSRSRGRSRSRSRSLSRSRSPPRRRAERRRSRSRSRSYERRGSSSSSSSGDRDRRRDSKRSRSDR